MKQKQPLKASKKLNKKLDLLLEALKITDVELAARLGYRNSSPISKRRSGQSPWDVRDAFALESISGGAITKEDVCPQFFKKHRPNTSTED